jgi:hypothetical protein
MAGAATAAAAAGLAESFDSRRAIETGSLQAAPPDLTVTMAPVTVELVPNQLFSTIVIEWCQS